MTSLPASRRDFARHPGRDDDEPVQPALELPRLPTPGPQGRGILALFDPATHDIGHGIGPGLFLH